MRRVGLSASAELLFSLNLLTGQKSGFSPAGRLVAPIHVKLGRTDGHLGPFG